MEKKGGGHLEIILAFTIFFVIVVFLFVYIRPLETDKLSDIALINLKDSFIRNSETKLIIVYVNGSLDRCAPEGFLQNWEYRNISNKDTDYYVYFSEEFMEDKGRCDPLKINLGSIISRKLISNNSLIRMQEEYYSNYSGLKTNLKIPAAIDFEIYSLDGEYNLTKGEKGEVDIIAREYTFSVLNSKGELINKRFRFRIW